MGGKNLSISSSEDMRTGFIRYYNGTLTQICGFSWEEVQSHLAWRMALHVAHISPAHWLSQSRALARLVYSMTLPPSPLKIAQFFIYFLQHLGLKWFSLDYFLHPDATSTQGARAQGHRFLQEIFQTLPPQNVTMIVELLNGCIIVNNRNLSFGLVVGQGQSPFLTKFVFTV